MIVFQSYRPYFIIRTLLAGVFIWAGLSKLVEPEVFAVLIDAYGLIPDLWVRPAAILLPLLEVIAGLGLLLDLRGSLAVIAALLLLFIGILAYGIHLGLDIDCGCFAPEEPEAKAYHGLRSALHRDLLMAVAIGYLYMWRRARHFAPRRVSDLMNLIFPGRYVGNEKS
jgi:uncharacterized membrane protein YphA (DoxX/SURF4 family)